MAKLTSQQIATKVNRLITLKRLMAEAKEAKAEADALAVELGVGVHESKTGKVKVTPGSSTTTAWKALAEELLDAEVIAEHKPDFSQVNNWLKVTIV